MDNPFKNGSGVWYTKQLFYEYADTSRENVLYTFKEADWKGFPSMRRLYLECDDQTETLFYTKYFDGFPHWKKLLACTWFVDEMEKIREEHQALLFHRHIQTITEKAKAGDLKATQYLLEKAWIKGGVGRTTKAKINQEAQRLKDAERELFDDFNRIQLIS